jgi:hypothetical protein
VGGLGSNAILMPRIVEYPPPAPRSALAVIAQAVGRAEKQYTIVSMSFLLWREPFLAEHDTWDTCRASMRSFDVVGVKFSRPRRCFFRVGCAEDPRHYATGIVVADYARRMKESSVALAYVGGHVSVRSARRRLRGLCSAGCAAARLAG